MTEHDFDHLPDVSFPIADAAGSSSALHETVAGLVAPSKVVAIALNTSLYADDDDARRVDRRDRGRDGPADATTRSGSAATALWAAIRDGGCSRRCADARARMTLSSARGRCRSRFATRS